MLTSDVLGKVIAQVKELAAHSWEYGTAAEALLEFDTPGLSVFGKDPFPGDNLPTFCIEEVQSLKYARQHIKTDEKTLCDDETGVADPAALGVFAIFIGQSERSYLDAAHRQIAYLMDEAPRYRSGQAISHRKDVEEVWADFIYMVPPFLAYYAVAVKDVAYMRAAIDQCIAYHGVLCTRSEDIDQGLWHHIAGPRNADAGYWSTSNGWVAAGLARVLAALMSWAPTRGWCREAVKLQAMIQEVVDGVIVTDEGRRQQSLLPNYLHANGEHWFGEVSGTALLASVVYRMAVLDPSRFVAKCGRADVSYVDWADNKRMAVYACVDQVSGIATPAVNPLKHTQRTPLTGGSPEGQSFVILLWSAHRDYMHAMGLS